MSTIRHNQAALDAYGAAQERARTVLAEGTRYLDAHQDASAPEAIHWGHVGDIQRLITGLSELIDENA